MKETPYVLPKIGRKHKNNQVTDGDANLENQSKKKHKKGGSNLESVIQKWFEQQEARQKELDRKKEEREKKEQEQKAELLHMKHQSDMMLFGILNNLTNNLSSFHKPKFNNQLERPFNQTNQTNQGKYFNLKFKLRRAPTHEIQTPPRKI
jgi:hypothetical protein